MKSQALYQIGRDVIAAVSEKLGPGAWPGDDMILRELADESRFCTILIEGGGAGRTLDISFGRIVAGQREQIGAMVGRWHGDRLADAMATFRGERENIEATADELAEYLRLPAIVGPETREIEAMQAIAAAWCPSA